MMNSLKQFTRVDFLTSLALSFAQLTGEAFLYLKEVMMNSSIQLYSYGEEPVRVIMLGDPPAAWFVAKDVCDILGYTNSRKALSDHLDDDEKDVTICYTPGGEQKMNIINESGLYCLILRSNMPKAKEAA